MSRKITVEGLYVSDEDGERIRVDDRSRAPQGAWPWFTMDDLIGRENRDHPVRVEIEIKVTRLD